MYKPNYSKSQFRLPPEFPTYHEISEEDCTSELLLPIIISGITLGIFIIIVLSDYIN